jgi:hypothetical protein
MTTQTLKDYLKTEAKNSGVAPVDIDSRVNSCVNMGLDSFWGAWDWYFKKKKATFSVTTTATTYDAPNDFGGMIKITSQLNSTGDDIRYMNHEDFNAHFPKPSGDSSGTPQVVTCFMDDGKWKLQFYPRPSASQDFDLVYEMEAPSAVEVVPSGFVDGVVLYCAKYLYPLGSPQGFTLEKRAAIVLDQLKIQNKVNKAPITNLGGKDEIIGRMPVWADYNQSIA